LSNIWYGGIDPGKHGAMCLKSGNKILIFDYHDLFQTACMLQEWQDEYDIHGVFLELVNNRPDDGGTSAFRFGVNYGIWQGALAALGIPFQLIRPQEWRKGLFNGMPGKTTKKQSLALARQMFPECVHFLREQDHDRAEAMLLAFQAERYFNSGEDG